MYLWLESYNFVYVNVNEIIKSVFILHITKKHLSLYRINKFKIWEL